jgi:putative transposase
VSYTHLDPVKEYIRTQEEHHRQTDFIEELKRLLEKNGVEYKTEYLV